jgi:hypothetical protein
MRMSDMKPNAKHLQWTRLGPGEDTKDSRGVRLFERFFSSQFLTHSGKDYQFALHNQDYHDTRKKDWAAIVFDPNDYTNTIKIIGGSKATYWSREQAETACMAKWEEIRSK